MHQEGPRSAEWGDIAPDDVQELIKSAEGSHWQEALDAFAKDHPFFVHRLSNLGLANWHVLIGRPRSSRALDIGCGFGTLATGLRHYYDSVVGIDMLPERLEFARLRAAQEGLTNTQFELMSALDLKVDDGSFDLITMNGVLEWAGLYAGGPPRALQIKVLHEVKRALSKNGVVGVAIENRFAMETLSGMEDTHTGVRLLPALPRPMASVAANALTGRPFRTFLYSLAGYRKLFSDAGFGHVHVLDLVSSYNDYDFVVSPSDAATYQFLWERSLVRSFHRKAGIARRVVARWHPQWMGHFSYAYLIVAGDDPRTMLDPTHRIWQMVAPWGIEPGTARFASPGRSPGTLLIFTHDGHAVKTVLELGADLDMSAPPLSLLDARISSALVPSPRLIGENVFDGLSVRAFAPAV